MSGAKLLWCGALLLLAAAPGRAQGPAAKDGPKDSPAALARLAWTITDLVLERDLDPPARQQMLLSGLRALLRPGAGPADLATRVSAVTTPEQFATLLKEVYPEARPADAPAEEGENPLLHGLFGDASRFGAGYLSPRGLQVYEILTGNRYVGTGIQIRWLADEKLTQIVVPFPGGPARKAGARVGDVIVEVDGKDMTGVPLAQTVKRIQGEAGTRVTFTVRQPGEKKTRKLDMIRGEVPFTSWAGYRRVSEEGWSFRVDPDVPVGYLQLTDVKSSTLLELRKLEPLVREQGVRALVLDLRVAQGREMTHAALVADALLDGGLMWKTRDRRGQVQEYKADRDCLFRGMPLAVLVSEHTHGMAQAIAAALQDNRRAVLVGQPTRGDVFVHTLVPLPDKQGGVLARTARVERAGKSTQAAAEMPQLPPAADAVRPDHEVALDGKQLAAILDWRHAQDSPEPNANLKAPADAQLAKAVAVLRELLAGQGAGKKPAG
jgi:carboxyl-terminal processing protease